ncbi:MAG: M16 family metallopeptidase, partial [Verrucomicrobiota bacterium]
PPGRVALRMLVEVGSLMEQEEERGLAHFLEHMAFQGTEHYPAGEMVEYFETLGMAHGADTNAHTSYKETVYKLQLPESDEELLNTGLELFRDYADGMLLEKEDIDDERGVILSERRQRDNVDYRMHKSRMRFLFPDHRLSKRHPIGTKDVIKNASRERFVKFYENWYRPERIAIIAVGDIEVEELEELIQKHFASLEPPEEPVQSPELEKLTTEGVRAGFKSEGEAAQTTVSIETVKSLDNIGDNRESRKNQLYREVANQIISERLEEKAKEEDAPFDSGIAYCFDWLDFVRWGCLRLATESEDWQAALKTAEQSLRRALEHGFHDSELDVAKAKILSNYRQAAREAATRKSGTIADNIVRSLVGNDVFTTPEYDLEFVQQALEELTVEEVHGKLKEIWGDDDNRNIFISGDVEFDREDEEQVKQDILAVYKESRAEEVTPLEDKGGGEFEYNDFGEKGEVMSEQTVEGLDVELLDLANNVKLNLKKTDFEDNQIRIVIRFGSGKLVLPEDKPGLALLAENVFIGGGLGLHSNDELERILAGKNVNVSFSVGEDAFVLSGNTTPEDFQSQMRLMTAHITDPGYREEALRQARKGFRKQYRRLEHTLDGVFESKVKKFLAGGDYRFGLPPQEELMQRNLKEVEDWLEDPLQNAPMSVSVVGDFNEDKVVETVSNTIGSLPERRETKPDYDERRELDFPVVDDDVKIFNYNSDLAKSMALVFYPAPDMYDIQRTRRLQILSKIISNRMREELREERGQVYSPQAWTALSAVYDDYGYLGAMVITSPENAMTMPDSIEEIAREIAADGITEEELKRAKNPMVKQLQETVRNNQYWLRNVLMSCREYPQRLEWAETMEEDVKSITRKEINSLAVQYLKDEEAVKILIMPLGIE